MMLSTERNLSNISETLKISCSSLHTLMISERSVLMIGASAVLRRGLTSEIEFFIFRRLEA